MWLRFSCVVVTGTSVQISHFLIEVAVTNLITCNSHIVLCMCIETHVMPGCITVVEA